LTQRQMEIERLINGEEKLRKKLEDLMQGKTDL
jgi:hypothetical protein